VSERHAKLDVLVNNAGVMPVGPKTSGVRADAGSPVAMDTLLKDVEAI
jgi:NADP-dependent 3-hydroxy acid dehydrogenase YdfG